MSAVGIKSKLPCVIFDLMAEEYAPKGWMWYRENQPWTKDIKESKVYRNSAGAKNASRGAKLPKRVLLVREFHKELERN